MKKRIFALLICVIMLMGSMSSAFAETSRIKNVYVMTGSIYYCDYNNSMLVLKNVLGTSDDESVKSVTKKIEYTEVRVNGNSLFMKDGTKIELADLNVNADRRVRVIVSEQEDGTLSFLHLICE